MDRSRLISWGILAIIAVCACVGIAFLGIFGGAIYLTFHTIPTRMAMLSPEPYRAPTATPQVIQPTAVPDTLEATLQHPPLQTPSPQVTRTNTPSNQELTDSLLALQAAVVPTNDPIELAQRFLGLENSPRSLAAPAEYYQVGDEQKFWVTDKNDQNTQIIATLRYVSEHTYFWVENGVSYNQSDLRALADTFEQEIYPTDRDFFGSEWTPGVDGDPHIYILYARGIGDEIAGYFSSADEYPQQVNQFSNAHEMFVFNADNSPLNDT